MGAGAKPLPAAGVMEVQVNPLAASQELDLGDLNPDLEEDDGMEEDAPGKLVPPVLPKGGAAASATAAKKEEEPQDIEWE